MTTSPVSRRARAWLELAGEVPTPLPLVGDRMTIGRTGADLELSDPSVSRLHAVLERVSTGWIVHDLGSSYGTAINGVRAAGARVVRDGDTLSFGSTTLIFRCADAGDLSLTAPPPGAPRLTPRERDLLVALCRPVLRDGMLSEPASLREIAAELVISESAVKKLLTRVYDRFELTDELRRRAWLAAEALRRGVITTRDGAAAR